MTPLPGPCGLLTLLTDFGSSDGYVAAMKGIVYSTSPTIRVVDITHEVESQDVFRAAMILRQVAATFPVGTVHVAVVDPGVGTSRKPLAVESRGQFFVGPDNGVLALAAAEPRRIHEITNAALMQPTLSDTFHGRDIFAPVAAHLACDTSLQDVGPALTTMKEIPVPLPVHHPEAIEAEVVYADRYGNLMLNVHADEIIGIDRASFITHIGGFVIEGLHITYGDVRVGELVVYIGSSGYIEVARREGNARHYLGAPHGTKVVLNHAPKAR